MGDPPITLGAMTEELRTALRNAGGMVSSADLARWWGFSHTAVKKMARREGFPRPALIVGQYTLYAGNECAAWYRECYPDRPEPGPDPREDTVPK